MSAPSLTTKRLRLRDWRDGDLAPFAALNADPRVMQHFPGVLTRSESDRLAALAQAPLAERGFGWWAVDEQETGAFVGFVGLSVPSFDAHFTPCVETGWRLAFEHWGRATRSRRRRRRLLSPTAFWLSMRSSRSPRCKTSGRAG